MTESIGFTPAWQTASLVSMPTLDLGELHVWWLPLELTEAQQTAAKTLLSDIQRDRYLRRQGADAQHAYLAGRYYLLTLLGAYTGIEAHAVQLSYTRLNKPYLSNRHNDLHFNFTDTRDIKRRHGVFAFSRQHAVGIDIENTNRRNNFQAIAQSRFTAPELEYVNSNGSFCVRRFLAIWTRKEAFGKATGKGINFKMNEQDLCSGDHPELLFFGPDDRAWRQYQLALSDTLIASVVHETHEPLAIKAFNALEM
ncbi:4'-phosphopantetheinyl transferase family protein [Arenicella xantha]|uniref:4'-phosphopantetheinyl transferase superfamily protein n=1 Tax=Arenicella xantha TaxID=644221 RepID=A0A395JJF3_9GAMM|nr:4'-phosphopantetheinyl transferase superfamily protein [Arenicella xantha]RBP48898.1 4'-phosphopantetheinyl transferase superfamily protein [Arenicella xantha]